MLSNRPWEESSSLSLHSIYSCFDAMLSLSMFELGTVKQVGNPGASIEGG